MIQLSGRQSADHWKQAVATADNTSRIDVAVDSELKPPVAALAVQLYRQMRRHRTTPGRTAKRTLWTSTDGGATVYVGSRVSENYGRVYDKGQETGTAPAGVWWRWEIELKGETSKSNANAWLLEDAGCNELAAVTCNWFRARLGTAPPSFSTAFVHNVPSNPSTIDRQLRWLSTGVRPTVQRLLHQIPRERILQALGLEAPTPQRPPTGLQGH